MEMTSNRFRRPHIPNARVAIPTSMGKFEIQKIAQEFIIAKQFT